MLKMICDFCGREIRHGKDYAKATLETPTKIYGDSFEQELHLHMACATRLRNKVNQFISEEGRDT